MHVTDTLLRMRRTQEERSSTTQAALVDAAIELLVTRGWAATTAVQVCEQAGVTRGALLHHYPNLGGLLAAALERLYDDMLTTAGTPAGTIRGALDRAWTAVSDRRFKAVMEAWWAAGNDPDLAQSIGPVVARFATLVAPHNAASERVHDARAATFLLTARESLLGLAMGRATSGGRALGHEQAVLDALRAQADELDASHLTAKEVTA
jgi:AcrR family transcriptional regulator